MALLWSQDLSSIFPMPPPCSPYHRSQHRAASSTAYPSPNRPSRASGEQLPPAHSHNLYDSRSMSGFLSSEAEMALLGEEEQAQQLFHQAIMEEEHTRQLYQQGKDIFVSHMLCVCKRWRDYRLYLVCRSRSGVADNLPGSSSPYPPTTRSNVPYINPSPWSPAMNPSTMGSFSPMPHTPTVPSSPYNLPSTSQSTERHDSSWSALHPEFYQSPRSRAGSGSDISRSSSPNPAELHNFGYPLADGCVDACVYSVL